MDNIKQFIESIEREIELLTEDLYNTKNDVSKRSLQRSIDNRKDRINEITEKYLSI